MLRLHNGNREAYKNTGKVQTTSMHVLGNSTLARISASSLIMPTIMYIDILPGQVCSMHHVMVVMLPGPNLWGAWRHPHAHA